MKFLVALNLVASISALTTKAFECAIEKLEAGSAYLPIRLPKPHGNYGVGVFYHDLTDETRSILIDGVPTPRLMELNVFYPTDQPLKATADPQYCTDDHWANIVYNYNIDRNTTSPHVLHWAELKAPPTTASNLPILVFSHGLGVPVEQYTAVAQDIASTGRVVVQITHTGYAYSTVLANDLTDMLQCYTDSMALCPFPADSNQMVECLDSKCPGAYQNNIYPTFVNDVRYVLDHLKALPWGPLADKLDLTNIGVAGHSIGGAVATNISIVGDYPNVLFALNLDGDSHTFGTDFKNLDRIVFKHFVSESTAKSIQSQIPSKFETIVPNSVHMDFALDTAYVGRFDVAGNIHCKIMEFIETSWN